MNTQKPLDTITVSDVGTTFSGPGAVSVFRLAAIASGLRLEMEAPKGMKVSRVSALSAAKKLTGLKTNNRDIQLDKIMGMLGQAKSRVLYLNKEYRPKIVYKPKK